MALLGPSGCGKSTILNMVATLIAPNGGAIKVDGATVVPGRPMRQVGYVFQKDTLFPWRTVEGNIGYALELAKVLPAERKERVAEAIHLAGLDGFGHFYPSSLSGGMRELARQTVDHRNDLVALRHGKRAARTEIVLHVDDDEDVRVGPHAGTADSSLRRRRSNGHRSNRSRP